MRLQCQRKELLAAVQLAAVAVPSRDHKPVLRNLKARVTPERCSLLATDLELGLRLDVSGLSVEEPGEVLLPAKRMLDILRETPDESLALETTEQACFVRGLNNEFEMSGEDPASFPDVPDFTDEEYHEVQAGTLREMIRRTIFAAGTDQVRYTLTGILWELEGEKARLVATDGRRLAVAEGSAVPHGGEDTNGVIHVVPTKAMHLLEKNLPDPEEKVRVRLRQNEALFKTRQATLYSRLVEGRYPEYRKVIPKKLKVQLTLPVGPFLTAVRQAAIMAEDDNRNVSLTFSKKKLVLEARGPACGRSKVELPINYGGKSLEIAFNASCLADLLRALDGADQVALEMTDGKTPALFRCGDNYLHVLMPLS